MRRIFDKVQDILDSCKYGSPWKSFIDWLRPQKGGDNLEGFEVAQKASDQLLTLGFVMAPVFMVISASIVIADGLYQ